VRGAQDDYNLYQGLRASLTEEAKTTLLQFSNIYTVNGHKSGIVFLRIIVRESHIDTAYTSRHIREQFSKLDQYMENVCVNNITAYNKHVYVLEAGLTARGETSTDKNSNVMKGLKACDDPNFHNWAIRKQDDFDEGTPINLPLLMKQAENKYLTAVMDGDWKATTKEQKEASVIALEAKLNGTQEPPPRTNNSKKNRNQRNLEAWMTKEPKNGEPQTMMRGNKQWHWCPHHGQWTIHLPAKCKIGLAKQAALEAQSQPGARPNMVLDAAMQAILEDDE